MTKINKLRSLTFLIVFSLISSCASNPTPDAAAISTQAASTVEARFTELAMLTPTEVPATNTPEATATKIVLPTPTNDPGVANGKPCFAMTFLSDVTIPDGMLITKGSVFTKTWRVRNDGNCVWDPSYTLTLNTGDAMTDITEIPLTRSVYPDDTIDLSIELTAPEEIGDYTGYWHVATPYGGYMGVGSYNQSLKVQIEVADERRFDEQFNAVSVEYDWTRRPQKGCTSDGAYYDFTAKITANGPGKLTFTWDRNPFDGTWVGGNLTFTEAGSQTVYWTWHMTKEHIQGIDRWVSIHTTSPEGGKKYFSRLLFNFTCN